GADGPVGDGEGAAHGLLDRASGQEPERRRARRHQRAAQAREGQQEEEPQEAVMGLLRTLAGFTAAGLAAGATPAVPAAARFYAKTEVAPGRTFPSPLVNGTVNGRPTKIVVDSGAQVSVVDAKLAAEAALVIAGSVEAQDPSGQAVAMRRTLDARLSI